MSAESTLSKRSQRALQPALSYWQKQFDGAPDLHSAENPEGYVLMAVAENRLSFHLLREKLSDPKYRQLTDSTGSYDNMRGRLRLRTAFAQLMEQNVTAGATVHPDQLVISAGAGQIISSLSYLLLDPNDSIMLFTPTYGALYNDFSVLSACQVVDVPFDMPGYRISERVLEDARRRAPTPVRMLFLIQPCNPLGIVHSREEIELAIRWSRRHRIHCVVDEIYANSVYMGADAAPQAHEFVSAATICADEADVASMAAETMFCMNDPSALLPIAESFKDVPAEEVSLPFGLQKRQQEHQQHPDEKETQPEAATTKKLPTYLGDYVHVIWGFSKDWAASGLRVGVLYSHNSALIRAFDNIAYFAAVANDTQDTLAAICEDGAWVAEFFAANRCALHTAFESLAPTLRSTGIPFVEPTAGMFVWLDLRAYMPSAADCQSSSSSSALLDEPNHPFARERLLTERLYRELKILFTPGEACHASEPGFFRCCFAWMPTESLIEGFRRLAAWAEKERAK